MQPFAFFRHCPRCGQAAGPPATVPVPCRFRCVACAFQYFFNPTVAVAVFLRRDDGRALFIRRAKDPGRGLLAPPGGFIDIGETAEDAARREVLEEVGLEFAELAFLCSAPNEYTYGEVSYPVLDLFFVARALSTNGRLAPDEVAECVWLDPIGVEPGTMAFPSMRNALRTWQTHLMA